jgi:hypothetical protein
MRRKFVFVGVLLIGSVATLSSERASSTAEPAFKKIQALAGNWQGTDDHGMKLKTSFKVIAANTAIMETLVMSESEEMVTIFSLDGETISLIHYCPTGNQPHMQALPPSGPIQELTFEFKDARNLPSATAGHEHKLVLRFEDANHISEAWTWRRDGRDTVMIYHFTRNKL